MTEEARADRVLAISPKVAQAHRHVDVRHLGRGVHPGIGAPGHHQAWGRVQP